MSSQPPPSLRNEDPFEGTLEPAFQSVIDISLEAYKQMGLMNGGAIIAILTFLGHAGAKFAVPGLVISLGLFAIGLWLNIESMIQARATQLAIYNREWFRIAAVTAVQQLNVDQAQARLEETLAQHALHQEYVGRAVRLFRGSVAAFVAGAVCAVLTMLAYL